MRPSAVRAPLAQGQTTKDKSGRSSVASARQRCFVQMLVGREVYKSKWVWVLTSAMVGTSISAALIYRHNRAQVAELSDYGASCENDIGAVKAHARSAA